MDLTNILYPVLVIGGLGCLFGAGLAFSAKKFAVKVDPLVGKIREALPSANCAGCGYVGCDAFAAAVANGSAAYTGCPVGGASVAKQLAQILGLDPSAVVRKVAYVKCNGTCDNAKNNYLYSGMESCVAASHMAADGYKACRYGCLGLKTCVRECAFDALHIVDGIAVVDPVKCTSCGKCVPVCPKNLIEIVPDEKKVRVECNSKDKGKDTKAFCSVGCIGCKICQKTCRFDAIHVEDNIAHIDYEKCTQCMECVKKCPTKIIRVKDEPSA